MSWSRSTAATPGPTRARLIDQACRVLRDERAPRAAIERLCRARGIGVERFRQVFAAHGLPAHDLARSLPHRPRARAAADHRAERARDRRRLGRVCAPSFSLFFKAGVGLAPGDYRARRRPG